MNLNGNSIVLNLVGPAREFYRRAEATVVAAIPLRHSLPGVNSLIHRLLHTGGGGDGEDVIHERYEPLIK